MFVGYRPEPSYSKKYYRCTRSSYYSLGIGEVKVRKTVFGDLILGTIVVALISSGEKIKKPTFDWIN